MHTVHSQFSSLIMHW